MESSLDKFGKFIVYNLKDKGVGFAEDLLKKSGILLIYRKYKTYLEN